jgi:hypothetical protein
MALHIKCYDMNRNKEVISTAIANVNLIVELHKGDLEQCTVVRKMTTKLK